MNRSDVKIFHPQSEFEWAEYFRIRYEVLRKPWNQHPSSTKDDAENISLHWLMTDLNNRAVATGRLQINSPDEGQLRSMAVSPDLQGKGLGTLMVEEIEKEARKRNLKRIILDARENAVEFYKQNGYEVIDTSYLLFGIIPHFKMTKTL